MEDRESDAEAHAVEDDGLFADEEQWKGCTEQYAFTG